MMIEHVDWDERRQPGTREGLDPDLPHAELGEIAGFDGEALASWIRGTEDRGGQRFHIASRAEREAITRAVARWFGTEDMLRPEPHLSISDTGAKFVAALAALEPAESVA